MIFSAATIPESRSLYTEMTLIVVCILNLNENRHTSSIINNAIFGQIQYVRTALYVTPAWLALICIIFFYQRAREQTVEDKTVLEYLIDFLKAQTLLDLSKQIYVCHIELRAPDPLAGRTIEYLLNGKHLGSELFIRGGGSGLADVRLITRLYLTSDMLLLVLDSDVLHVECSILHFTSTEVINYYYNMRRVTVTTMQIPEYRVRHLATLSRPWNRSCRMRFTTQLLRYLSISHNISGVDNLWSFGRVLVPQVATNR